MTYQKPVVSDRVDLGAELSEDTAFSIRKKLPA